MLDSLTQEQKYTIAKFYKLYMERSNEGQSESEANYFGDSIKAQDDYFCDSEYDDFLENCKVLIDRGYLEGQLTADRIDDITVTNKAFTEIEQSFK